MHSTSNSQPMSSRWSNRQTIEMQEDTKDVLLRCPIAPGGGEMLGSSSSSLRFHPYPRRTNPQRQYNMGNELVTDDDERKWDEDDEEEAGADDAMLEPATKAPKRGRPKGGANTKAAIYARKYREDKKSETENYKKLYEAEKKRADEAGRQLEKAKVQIKFLREELDQQRQIVANAIVRCAAPAPAPNPVATAIAPPQPPVRLDPELPSTGLTDREEIYFSDPDFDLSCYLGGDPPKRL